MLANSMKYLLIIIEMLANFIGLAFQYKMMKMPINFSYKKVSEISRNACEMLSEQPCLSVRGHRLIDYRSQGQSEVNQHNSNEQPVCFWGANSTGLSLHQHFFEISGSYKRDLHSHYFKELIQQLLMENAVHMVKNILGNILRNTTIKKLAFFGSPIYPNPYDLDRFLRPCSKNHFDVGFNKSC